MQLVAERLSLVLLEEEGVGELEHPAAPLPAGQDDGEHLSSVSGAPPLVPRRPCLHLHQRREDPRLVLDPAGDPKTLPDMQGNILPDRVPLLRGDVETTSPLQHHHSLEH